MDDFKPGSSKAKELVDRWLALPEDSVTSMAIMNQDENKMVRERGSGQEASAFLADALANIEKRKPPTKKKRPTKKRVVRNFDPRPAMEARRDHLAEARRERSQRSATQKRLAALEVSAIKVEEEKDHTDSTRLSRDEEDYARVRQEVQVEIEEVKRRESDRITAQKAAEKAASEAARREEAERNRKRAAEIQRELDLSQAMAEAERASEVLRLRAQKVVFESWVLFTQNERRRNDQATNYYVYSMMFKTFHRFRRNMLRRKSEREAALHERNQRMEQRELAKAGQFRRTYLLRQVVQAWQLFVRLSKEKAEVRTAHQGRQLQMERFLAARQAAELAERRRVLEIDEDKGKDIEDQEESVPGPSSQAPEVEPRRAESVDAVESRQPAQVSNTMQAGRQPSSVKPRAPTRQRKTSRDQSAGALPKKGQESKPVVRKPETDIAAQMEERHKAREKKWKELQEKYDKQREAKKEEERIEREQAERAKQEERKERLRLRAEEERQKREAEERRVERNRIAREKLIRARSHHRLGLLRYYGLLPWKKLRQQIFDAEASADHHYANHLLRSSLAAWKDSVGILQEQAFEHARQLRLRMLLARGFAAFSNNLKRRRWREERLYNDFWDRKKLRVFFLWRKRAFEASQIRLEKELKQEKAAVEKWSVWQKQLVLKKLRKNVETNRDDRFHARRQEKMMGTAMQYLQEIRARRSK